jgi:hypothetical protein
MTTIHDLDTVRRPAIILPADAKTMGMAFAFIALATVVVVGAAAIAIAALLP